MEIKEMMIEDIEARVSAIKEEMNAPECNLDALTEEVKQLRYRNYKVDREAKKYKYFAPTLALKKKEGKLG